MIKKAYLVLAIFAIIIFLGEIFIKSLLWVYGIILWAVCFLAVRAIEKKSRTSYLQLCAGVVIGLGLLWYTTSL